MKDNTATKSTLLEHLIGMMLERYPDGTDLHGELNGVHRVAKVCVSVYGVHLSVCRFVNV